MKKILQVCAIDRSVESLLFPLIEKLMGEGYEVHNACSDTGRFDVLTAKGLTLRRIPIKRKIDPISNLVTIGALYRLMKREKYDVVHVHTPIAAVLGRVAARLAGVPHVIYTAHGYFFHEGMSKSTYQMYYTLEKWFARHMTDYLLLQSREDYELSVKDSFSSQTERILHIGNGVDLTERFHPRHVTREMVQTIKSSLGLRDEHVVITYVGRMVSEKGIFELLEAFRKLAGEFPRLRLLLVGDVSSSERDQRGQDFVGLCRQHPQIILAGFRTDIPELMAASDIFVLPSYREGLPRSIIEAMAMAKPIVATNIRGCREEVRDGVNGFLVEPKQVCPLYAALKKLVIDSRLREAFGQNSRCIALEHFDERTVLAKQVALFAQLTGQLREERGQEKGGSGEDWTRREHSSFP